jgi:HK97 family phage major capsid protein
MDTKELDTQLKTVHDGIKTVQETIDNVKDAQVADREQIEKASKAACDALQKINDSKADEKFAELKQQMEDIELAIAKDHGKDINAESNEYKHAMARYLRKGTSPEEELQKNALTSMVEKSLYGADDFDIEKQVKDLVAGSGPDGGYHLIADRSSRLIERIFETSPIRGLANIETTTSDVFEYLLDDDEADAGWVGEVSDRPDTDTPKIGMIKIPIHELYAQPRISQKMLDDAGFDVEGWLNRKVSSRFSRIENTAFVNGDGAEKPRGFLDYDPVALETYQRNAIGTYTSVDADAASGFFGADDLILLQNSLLEEYQGRASWAMNRQTFTTCMQLKDTNGRYLINPAIIAEGANRVLLGAGVTFFSDMLASGAGNAGEKGIVIADWNEFYTIVDRFDIRVLRDPYTSKPYIRYYTTKRTGGAVTNYQAGKILRFKA